MKAPPSLRSIAAGLAVIAVANGMILFAARENRRGEPRAELALTEREAALPLDREEENTSLFLTLELGDRPPAIVARAARARGVLPPQSEHPWLDRTKLRSLGFRIAVEPDDPRAAESYEQEAPALVFLALEMEGDAWARFIASQDARLASLRQAVAAGSASKKDLDDAEQLAALDQSSRSRLLPVDADRERPALAFRYPDRRRHAIVRGSIAVTLRRTADRKPFLGTEINLLVRGLHVASTLRPDLAPFLPRFTFEENFLRLRQDPLWPAARKPRYHARIAVGQRDEPWLVGVETGLQPE